MAGPCQNETDTYVVRCDDAYREFTEVSDAVIAELQQNLGVRLDSNAALLGQVRRTWDAGSAVTDALARPAPAAESGGR